MNAITQREFDIRQPYFPQKSETDGFYLNVANKLMTKISETGYGRSLSAGLSKHLALTLTGYYQDIISDAGLWRSFIEANRQLYGNPIPFHTPGEDYVDYELNREDVRFLTWYDIAMLDMERRDLNPHDAGLLAMADTLYDYLESEYDDAPVPEKYSIAHELSLKDPEDQPEILHLGNWLFNNSWLLTPAYALSLSEIASDPEVRAENDGVALTRKLDEALTRDPSGPLALYIPEWVYLMINGKLPAEALGHSTFTDNDPVHPYYTRFTEATGGKEIAYFGNYKELNDFFINALGWESGQEHLVQMKNEHDFVLLVNKHKGMLLAKNVAKCIKDVDNPLYNEAYARENAIYLLMMRGLCPADLIKYLYSQDMLPDARFPGSDDTELVKINHDFIARCYLQQYYRGD